GHAFADKKIANGGRDGGEVIRMPEMGAPVIAAEPRDAQIARRQSAFRPGWGFLRRPRHPGLDDVRLEGGSDFFQARRRLYIKHASEAQFMNFYAARFQARDPWRVGAA